MGSGASRVVGPSKVCQLRINIGRTGKGGEADQGAIRWNKRGTMENAWGRKNPLQRPGVTKKYEVGIEREKKESQR